MGYGHYLLPDGREAGYGIDAECDHPGCRVEIDRGLGWLCGELPDGHRDPAAPGCGRYYCGQHLDTLAHDCPNPIGSSWCDVAGCDEQATDCMVGESGDFWLCADHALAGGTDRVCP
jgi:hypothetical protein